MIIGLNLGKAECRNRIHMSQFKVVGRSFINYGPNALDTQYQTSKSNSILTDSVSTEHIYMGMYNKCSPPILVSFSPLLL